MGVIIGGNEEDVKCKSIDEKGTPTLLTPPDRRGHSHAGSTTIKKIPKKNAKRKSHGADSYSILEIFLRNLRIQIYLRGSNPRPQVY